MEALELILFLLAAVVASSILDNLLPRLSLPLVQIALGALIAAFVHTPLESGLDPELLLILFIAPLHFNESRHADSGALWANRWGIASLAVGLVFAIIISMGFTLHALLPAIPLAAALALGAAMGSTDAVAVMELSKDFKFGQRHKTLLEGEAFFNDVTGTVVFQCAIAVALTGSFSLVHAGEEFALDLFGGLFGGLVMGALAWALLEFIRRLGIDNPTLHVTLELLLPFLIYLIAEHLHIGGVIAVVCAGMMMSLLPHRHTAQRARQKLQSRSVWETLSFVLNGVIFVLLGMQLPRVLMPATQGGLGDPLALIGVMLVLTFVLELVRFIWVLGMDAVDFRARKRSGKASSQARFFTRRELRNALAMTFAGPKGGITLSLMLTVPGALALVEGVAVRTTLISIASGVILFTLLLANFAVPLLVPHKHEAKKTKERVDAEARLLEAVIESVQQDAHFTGMVTADAPEDASEGTAAADEPATVIVMKRYADQLADLLPHASADVAAHGRAVVAACDTLYDSIDQLAEEVAELDDDNAEGEDALAVIDPSKLTAHFRMLRSVYDAVEDVQAQALVRELEIIKRMRAAGELTPDQAKQLRNDVYIQQMTLD
ncbi:MAG: hypothetical protein HFJ66_00580 [Eggerthellaceae bacterium]|nr:hypothetical protein [Eggerthellaceae bacterium]